LQFFYESEPRLPAEPILAVEKFAKRRSPFFAAEKIAKRRSPFFAAEKILRFPVELYRLDADHRQALPSSP
jgi:hypothetical protein